MGLKAPFPHIWRPLVRTAAPFRIWSGEYLRDNKFATHKRDLIRGYHQLEKSLLRIFDFVEPADANIGCFSHELYALLLRASTEFEANSKAILGANGYSNPRNIEDYWKIEKATRLSEYVVELRMWSGIQGTFTPFKQWQHIHSLPWYQSYNDVKHNRAAQFASASLGNTVMAVAGVLAMLVSQFYVDAFDPFHEVTMHMSDDEGGDHGFVWHESTVFRVRPYAAWPDAECYHFDRKAILASVQNFPF